ncbi:nischarin-like isoform X2 [Mercenaria mercenaria]|uniref:nischarin-like isoform X2 n=1 Tax=Mercenaria mercenaria TaxID=6596 RepID=UPI00234F00BC|nr:nischarin-like isoform X2 [Mercenaria mercenaria]
MAQFGKDIDNVTASSSIKITDTETTDTFTIYVIEVTIGSYSWKVKHRYSDFHDLHEKLCSSCKLDKNLLPPKKLFGNQSESFIKKRQHDLEIYLQTVLHFVSQKMPNCLAAFLEFDQYEIHGITQVMAEELYEKGDMILQTRELYKTTPLHLYALTERLKLPEPTCESGDVKRDLGHILDFITRLKCIQVCGGKKIGNSNIDTYSLQFDLTLFKSLQKLELKSVNLALIGGLDTVKQTLQTITVNKSVSSIKEVLLQDLPQWKADDGTLLVSYWDNITHVDFSHNSITEIDDAMQLMPKVVRLDLSHNKITEIKHLQWLSHMTYLDMSYNDIEELEALHSKLGNLKTLNLAGNRLHSLQGLSKLFSLEQLDLSYNQVALVDDIKPINRLPCVEQLLLIGNPVTITLDYRTKTLALFGDRVSEICLDKEVTTEKELDTVKVLQAIQKSKDKAKEINIKKAASGASLTDLSHTPSSSSLGGYHGNTQSSGRGSLNTNTVKTLHIDTPDSGMSASPHLYPSSQPKKSPLRSVDLDNGNQQIKRISSSRPSSTSSISSSSLATHYVNITSLPDHKSSDFPVWLHTRLFGQGASSGETVEAIKCVLWCLVVQYSNRDTRLPCCVVLTERRVFILQLRNQDSPIQGVPAMETFYILPLCNIQQVLTGLCYSYIRIEESFVGPSGTFALVAADPDIGKEFFEELKLCAESNPEDCELDIINGVQDCDISKQIFDCEEVNGECTGRVALATHVTEAKAGSESFLVLSENHVYVFKSCSLFWPKPTFDVNEIETVPKFEIRQQFSVEAKISEINKYKVCEVRPSGESEKYQPEHNISNIKYQEYGLSMVFHEVLGSQKFDFQFLSKKVRDSFLDRLTSLRSEHAHRMSPTLRQEPEGGNESSDGSEDKEIVKDSNKEESIYKEAEIDSEDSDAENVEENMGIQSFAKRKLRSKTEIVFTKRFVETPEAEQDLPSYTLHYLTPELISHLEACVKRYTLFQPLSAKLQALREMNGQSLAEFFHTNIVPVGHDEVELHHVIWTNVIPYTNPKDEIVTCVMLSNRAVYFVSDRPVKLHQATGRPSWMTHARHVSDSVIGLQARKADKHHSSGILHMSESTEAIVKPFCVLDFADIKQINVGLFDQCLRLTGDKRETVFTLITRNSEMTSLFMKNLSTMLSLYIASPMLESSSSDLEQDFYKAFNKRTKTTLEGIEYVHPSRVKFCYPGDEAISDLLYLINEHLKSASIKVGRENILQYITGFKTQSQNKEVNSVLLEPISIILTNECLCFVTEDLVSYPLPDFVRGLPSMPRQYVTDVKKIEYLKYIKLNSNEQRDITLVFSDEKEDIILIPDHYSLKDTRGRNTAPEIPVRLLIQSEREVKKFLMLIKSQWKEVNAGQNDELPVHNI